MPQEAVLVSRLRQRMWKREAIQKRCRALKLHERLAPGVGVLLSFREADSEADEMAARRDALSSVDGSCNKDRCCPSYEMRHAFQIQLKYHRILHVQLLILVANDSQLCQTKSHVDIRSRGREGIQDRAGRGSERLLDTMHPM